MTGAAANTDVVLATRDVHMAFGGLVVFEKLNFELRRGERHAIIGPNGAGKTTFVSLVTGLLTPRSGDVLFNGAVITGLSPQQRVKAGLARTFQINTLFRGLNPLESVVLALCEREGRAGVSPRGEPRRPREDLARRGSPGAHCSSTMQSSGVNHATTRWPAL